jgi:diguanylate cyclase (GGDEF)-like protein/PAS domain S-box-containing protein
MSAGTQWSKRPDRAAVGSDEVIEGSAAERELRGLRRRLRQAEQLYRHLVESAGDILYRADAEGYFTYANPAAVRITGYPRDTIIGMHFGSLVRQDHRERMVEIYRNLMDSDEQGTYFEVPIVTAEGREVWLGQNLQLLRGDEGVTGVQAVARDITDTRIAQDSLRESEERFRTVADSLGEGIVITDLDDAITYVNSRACQMVGQLPEALLGETVSEVMFSVEGPEAAFRDEPTVIEASAPRPRKYVIQSEAHGSRRWLEVTSVPFRSRTGVRQGTLSLLQDVTERKLAEEENQRLAALSRENPNPVLECDANGRAIRHNAAAAEVVRSLGLSGVRDLLPAKHEELVASCLGARDGHTSVEVQVGNRILAWTYRPYPRANTVHLFAVDITSRRDMEEQLRYDALHDTLTGLPNRALFMERLTQTVRRGQRRADVLFAVLFLDLDRFKVVNDSLGHPAGDELLIAVAERLQKCLRPADTVARFGGDEFAILLEEMHEPADASRVAERIQQELTVPVKLGGFEVVTSASIGIALSTTGPDSPELLLRDADMAMYRAKGSGNARIEIFDRAMHEEALARLTLETDLRRALEKQEFTLHYQPIVRLCDRRILAIEALVRWRHPKQGLLMPDSFTAVAEETGLLAEIGRWVLREACRATREWRGRFPAHEDLSIGVNFSAKQLSHVRLVDDIEHALEATDLEPKALKLEIAESSLMTNAEDAVEILTNLRRVGIGIQIDDFGTGYSSLSYLHRFPLDALKIDRSFVGRLQEEPLMRQLVQTVLGMADGLGVGVIAEGIETAEQLETLEGLGCRYGQGHYFAEPMPADELERLLERGDWV